MTFNLAILFPGNLLDIKINIQGILIDRYVTKNYNLRNIHNNKTLETNIKNRKNDFAI